MFGGPSHRGFVPLSRSRNKDLFIYLFKKKHNDTNPWQIHYYIYRQLTHFDEVNSINISLLTDAKNYRASLGVPGTFILNMDCK